MIEEEYNPYTTQTPTIPKLQTIESKKVFVNKYLDLQIIFGSLFQSLSSSNSLNLGDRRFLC